MTKGEAIRIVERWVAALNSPNDSEATVAYANPPETEIKRLLQEVKSK